MNQPQHRADRYLEPDSDPREGGTSLDDERETLIGFLRCQRLTLQLKCQGLDAAQVQGQPSGQAAPIPGVLAVGR